MVRVVPGRSEVAPILLPVRTSQLYEQIRDQLLAQVLAGVWVAGQKLPSERELAEMLGVSRPSIREALGELALIGVVETRPGSGSRIARDAQAALQLETRRAVPRQTSVSPLALLEARAVIEPVTARLAAMRHRDDGVLETHVETMQAATDLTDPEQRSRWNAADRLFHHEIAQATDNPVFGRWADHVFAVMDEPLWRQLGDSMLTVPGRMQSSVTEHARIYKAIRTGDGELAARVARDHVRKVRHYMGLD